MNVVLNNIKFVENSNSPNTLRDGNTVYVRVLNKLGENQYLVSFRGQQFNIKSESPLVPGTGFKSIIKTTKNQVQLIPVKEQVFLEDNIENFTLKNFESNPQAKNLLQSLGLVPDVLSFKLLQMFQQNDLKLNPALINKIRAKAKSLAKKNPALNEEDIAESELALEFKKMDSSDRNVEKLLSLIQGNPENQESGKNHNSQNNQQKEENQEEDLENSGKDKIQSIIDVFSNPENLFSSKANILNCFNHIKIKNSNLHWLVLPYEFNLGDNRYYGSIRIIINLSEKKLKKMLINCSNTMKNYYFVLYYSYSKNEKNKIEFYEDSKEDALKDLNLLNKILNERNSKFIAEYNEDSKIQNLFTEDLPVAHVEVNV